MDKDSDQSTGDNRISSVDNVFNIIETIKELGQCGVSELAEHIDVPKSTAHAYLKTLEDLGYVINEDGQYQLGLRFLQLGGVVRHNRTGYQTARSEIETVSQETGEVGTIGYEEDGLRVLVYRSEPVEGVSDNAPTGEFTKMHWTALGKALLAQHTDDEIRDIVERHGLPEATENTITDLDTLFEETNEIRERGYSIEDEERVNGIKSVAVPITSENSNSKNIAISMAGPKHRFNTERIEDELLPKLQNAANVIELQSRHY